MHSRRERRRGSKLLGGKQQSKEALNRVSDVGETLESGQKTELLETLNEGSEGNQIILRWAVHNHPFPALPDRYCPGRFVSWIRMSGP